ncbi:putative YccA/Bax inhibitor family protein [Lacibacter cauensis]|uniref:Putative YccA/Bax inhibitor family protein n=1 Tax=Lacibacter cauensis TaxID=510947 RepID=A0A562SQB9_9BACT|nr:Bax inhibitor-1/YccA family protein [Lacibacter cauensis]TWI83449.1 putative YccA/Bax inhibitor family protein [Lacibacter cauensis]
MSLFKSGNPTLSEKQFQQTTSGYNSFETMTVRGTMNKFGFLMLMVMAGAAFSWQAFNEGKNILPYLLIGALGGLVVALIITFKKEWSGYLAPAYGILEGVFVGAISAYFNFLFREKYPDIIMHAVLLTFAVAASMYLLYSLRIIKVTERLRSVIFVATASIAVFYLLTWILGFFGIHFAFLTTGSTFGIVFSLAVIGIAALNLLLDFDMIERGSEMGAPKFMEWYGAFGLLVTLVWLYLEILRLLSKLNDRK